MVTESEKQAFIEYTKYVNERLYFYSSFVIVPIGVILNTLTIVVFSRKRFQKSNYGFLTIVMTVFNTFSLIWGIIIYKYLAAIDQDPSFISSFICFTFQYVSRSIQQFPTFIQCFISMYQYFEINSSKIHVYLKYKKNILLSIILIIFITSLINIPSLFKYLTISYKNASNKTIKEVRACKNSDIISLISNIETALMRTIIPLIILGYFSYEIVIKLINSKRKSHSGDTKMKKEAHFGLYLFVQNLICVVFNIPLAITYILVILYQNFLKFEPNSIETDRMLLIHGLTNAFSILYYSISFFIHFTFNHAFRNESLVLFKIKYFKALISKETRDKTYNSKSNTNSNIIKVRL